MLERTIYVSEYQPRKHYYALQKGEKITLTVDWSAVADAAATSVSSVEWDSGDSEAVSISNESLASNKASALVSADNCGSLILANKATMDDGQVRQAAIQVRVSEPGVNA